MKKVLSMALLIFMLVAVTACTAEAAATEELATEEASNADTNGRPTSTQDSAKLMPVEEAVIKHLSESLGISPDEITVVSTEEVEWPDGCLGLQEEGLMCTEAITPGFRVLLDANGREVEYHTDEVGKTIRPATILMTWKRSGGIAGFCDTLTIYLSGEVHKSSCRGDQSVEDRLIDVLSTAEMSRLDGWLESYGNIKVDASDPKGVADRMEVTLEFTGVGSKEMVSAVDEKELLRFAQALYQTLSKQ